FTDLSECSDETLRSGFCHNAAEIRALEKPYKLLSAINFAEKWEAASHGQPALAPSGNEADALVPEFGYGSAQQRSSLPCKFFIMRPMNKDNRVLHDCLLYVARSSDLFSKRRALRHATLWVWPCCAGTDGNIPYLLVVHECAFANDEDSNHAGGLLAPTTRM